MTAHRIYRFRLAIIAAIFFVTATGCSNAPSIPNDVLPSPTAAASVATQEPTKEPGVATVEATKEAVTEAGVQLKDDFTDPSTNWPEDKFDNYFIGYHEPEYYHIEIIGENYRTT